MERVGSRPSSQQRMTSAIGSESDESVIAFIVVEIDARNRNRQFVRRRRRWSIRFFVIVGAGIGQ